MRKHKKNMLIILCVCLATILLYFSVNKYYRNESLKFTFYQRETKIDDSKQKSLSSSNMLKPQSMKPIIETASELFSNDKRTQQNLNIQEIESDAKKYWNGRNWIVSNRDRSGLSPPKVYVFEEHHEVIEAWLKTDPNREHTLIHIDAHTDNAPLNISLVKTLKSVRPQNKEETKTFMQNNDDFITGSVYMGVLKTVFLLKPRFDEFFLTVNVTTEIGIVRDHPETACICSSDNKKCFTFNNRDSETMEEEFDEIHKNKCIVNYRYGLSELYLDHFMSDVLRKVLLNENTPIILDIDEDFFGVNLVTRRLIKDLRMNLDDVKDFRESFEPLFCSYRNKTDPDIEEELAVDLWYRQLLKEFIKLCNSTLNRFSNCPNKLPPHIYNEKTVPLFRRFPRLDCKIHTGHKSPIFLLQRIWSQLRKMKMSQVKELQLIGLCRTMSYRTLDYDWSYSPCLGHNYFGESAVDEYVHNSDSLNGQFNILQAVLARLPNPVIITICRSSRDGYVPRHQQPIIEKNILRVIESVYGSRDSDIIFDPYLAGGRNGWINRV